MARTSSMLCGRLVRSLDMGPVTSFSWRGVQHRLGEFSVGEVSTSSAISENQLCPTTDGVDELHTAATAAVQCRSTEAACLVPARCRCSSSRMCLDMPGMYQPPGHGVYCSMCTSSSFNLSTESRQQHSSAQAVSSLLHITSPPPSYLEQWHVHFLHQTRSISTTTCTCARTRSSHINISSSSNSQRSSTCGSGQLDPPKPAMNCTTPSAEDATSSRISALLPDHGKGHSSDMSTSDLASAVTCLFAETSSSPSTHHHQVQVFEQLLQLLEPQLTRASAKDLSTFLYAAGRLRYKQYAGWALLLRGLADNNHVKLQNTSFRTAVQLLSALAVAQASGMLRQAMPQSALNPLLLAAAHAAATALASTSTAATAPSVSTPDATQASRNRTKQITSALYACGQLQLRLPALMQLLQRELLQHLPICTAPELARSVWAIAKLTAKIYLHHTLLHLLLASACSEVMQRPADHFTPQQWSMLMTGLASLGWVEPRVLTAGAAAIARSSCISADDNFTDGISEEVSEGASSIIYSSGSGQTLVNALWACAACGHLSPSLPQLLNALQQLAESASNSLTARGVCNALWSMAVLGLLHSEASVTASLLAFVDMCWQNSADAQQHQSLNQQDLLQLHTVLQELSTVSDVASLENISEGQLAQKARAAQRKQLRGRLSQLTPSLLQAVRAAGADAAASRSPMVSSVQAHVTAVLQSSKVSAPGRAGRSVSSSDTDVLIKSVWSEVSLVPGGESSTDIVVELWDGRRVALEVDGEHHYATNNPTWPLGRTVLRNRGLGRKFGPDNVRVIHTSDWQSAVIDKTHRQLLQEVLQ